MHSIERHGLVSAFNTEGSFMSFKNPRMPIFANFRTAFPTLAYLFAREVGKDAIAGPDLANKNRAVGILTIIVML